MELPGAPEDAARVQPARPVVPKTKASKYSQWMTVRCPCGKLVKAPHAWAGRKGKCPGCGNELVMTLNSATGRGMIARSAPAAPQARALTPREIEIRLQAERERAELDAELDWKIAQSARTSAPGFLVGPQSFELPAPAPDEEFVMAPAAQAPAPVAPVQTPAPAARPKATRVTRTVKRRIPPPKQNLRARVLALGNNHPQAFSIASFVVFIASLGMIFDYVFNDRFWPAQVTESWREFNAPPETPRMTLVQAVRSDNFAQAKAILSHGGNVEETDAKGMTALNAACVRGNVDIARLLIDCGASVTRSDDEGRTPLHWAAGCGKEEIAKLLLEHGAILERDQHGNTPLDEANLFGHKSVSRRLVESAPPQRTQLVMRVASN